MQGPSEADETSSLRGDGQSPAGTSWVKRFWRFLLDNDKSMSYTFLTTLSTAPTLLFAAFHMAAFLKMHSISTSQVAAASMIYVIWDCSSNLFAGYVSDTYASKYGTRLSFVVGVQLLWVLTTFTPFIPLPQSTTAGFSGTLYYLLCISIYDGFASLVNVARGTLMAEITYTEGDCVHLKRLNSVLGCVEGAVTLAAYALWDPAHPAPFLSYMCCIMMASILINFASAYRLSQYTVAIPSQEQKRTTTELPPPSTMLKSLSLSAWAYIAVMALHEFQGVIWSKFGVVVLDTAFANSSKFWRVSFMGFLSSAGGIAAFLVTWVADRIGVYRVLLWTFRCKALGAVLLVTLAMLEGLNDYLVGLGMLLIEVSADILAGFSMLVMVNLINELSSARQAAGVQHPLSGYSTECGPALLMGVSAFFVKPFNTLGTVLGTAVLAGPAVNENVASDRTKDFQLLAGVLLAVGLAQWVLWSNLFLLRSWMRLDIANDETESGTSSTGASSNMG